MASTSKNHEKAPVCAAFVKSMREVFGEITVLYVEEGPVKLGEKEESIEEYMRRVSGIWYCPAHARDALDGAPVPRMRGVPAKAVAGE